MNATCINCYLTRANALLDLMSFVVHMICFFYLAVVIANYYHLSASINSSPNVIVWILNLLVWVKITVILPKDSRYPRQQQQLSPYQTFFAVLSSERSQKGSMHSLWSSVFSCFPASLFLSRLLIFLPLRNLNIL